MALFKGAVSRDFLAFFIFHESKPSGPPGKQAKIVLLKSLFSGKISEKFVSDSAQANTARSRTLRTAQANTARSRQLKCLQIQNWLTRRGVKN